MSGSRSLAGSKKGCDLKGWLRLFLPGVFAEVHHWQERAERAEARLGEVVSQFATTIAHEKEQHDARERYLLEQLLAWNTSQKPPVPEEEWSGALGAAPTQFTHPIQRKIQEFYKEQQDAIPEEMVEAGVEEYLRLAAIH